jgi:tripartite-type tricarboxylate transporter receptor subunit TctC
MMMKPRKRRDLLAILAASAVVGLTVPGVAAAQTFPSKPIRIIVPFSAGDLADTIARMLGPKMSDQLGQPVLVENRPGASGLIGLQTAMQAEPDGHTLVLGQMGGMAVAPNINRQPFSVREEFIPVAPAYANYMLLVAHPSVQGSTLPELIAYSKANPGKLTLATNGQGGFPHLAMELLREQTGLDYVHVPYKGASQIPLDIIGGRVDLTILGYSSLIQHVQGGKLKAIAVTGPERPVNSPNIPTMGETVPGYSALGWFGFFARKGTPPAAITAINDAVNAALKAPDVAERARTFDIDPMPGAPGDLEKLWRQDFDRWGRLIRELNLSPK